MNNPLHDHFIAALLSQLQTNKFKATFIKKKLEDAGFKVSEETLEEIEQKLENLSGDGLIIETIGVDVTASTNPNYSLNLADGIEEFATKILQEAAAELIPQLTESSSKVLLKSMKKEAPAILKERAKQREAFETILRRTWGKAIDALEVLIVSATEAGDHLNNEYKKEAEQNNNWVFFCLARLQARACQIASEILTLLKAGYPDGALARWRVLHETAVTGYFIEKHGPDTAEQYLHYNAVESMNAAIEFNAHCSKLKIRPISNRDLIKLQKEQNSLIAKYGEAYGKGNYGWAASALGKKKVDYKDIEADAKISHLRPYYKQASTNIHVTPKGLYFALGTNSSNVLHTGPSTNGLTSPGQLTAISLLQITLTFLQLETNLDRVVLCNTLTKLEKEVNRTFGNVREH